MKIRIKYQVTIEEEITVADASRKNINRGVAIAIEQTCGEIYKEGKRGDQRVARTKGRPSILPNTKNLLYDIHIQIMILFLGHYEFQERK